MDRFCFEVGYKYFVQRNLWCKSAPMTKPFSKVVMEIPLFTNNYISSFSKSNELGS